MKPDVHTEGARATEAPALRRSKTRSSRQGRAAGNVQWSPPPEEHLLCDN